MNKTLHLIQQNSHRESVSPPPPLKGKAKGSPSPARKPQAEGWSLRVLCQAFCERKRKGDVKMEMQTVLLSNQRWKEVNPIQFGWSTARRDFLSARPPVPILLLHYVVSGKGVFTVGGRSYDLGPGQIL